jgi:molecular chaperone GrpE
MAEETNMFKDHSNGIEQDSSNSQEVVARRDLEQCKSQIEDWKNKFLRAQADFDNFTRRIEKEKVTWLRAGQMPILRELLNIVDDVDRALANQVSSQLTPELQQWLAGFSLIGKALHKLITSHGVEEIKQISTFDPTIHEALIQVDAADRKSGDIIEVLQKGYMFKGEVLRAAKVSVAK